MSAELAFGLILLGLKKLADGRIGPRFSLLGFYRKDENIYFFWEKCCQLILCSCQMDPYWNPKTQLTFVFEWHSNRFLHY